jgi:hypothetical protein
VELVTIWLYSILFLEVARSLLRITEAMVLIAIWIRVCAIVLVLVLVKLIQFVKLIVSTIGGIETGIPTRFIPIEFAAPVILVFCYHFVSASATLGVVVVCWNCHNILWIDLDNHCLSIFSIREVWKILNRTEVESVGAGALLVLVHRIARHLTYLAHRVVEVTRMNVLVIRTNILESEEVTILCDWEFSCFKEVVEFIYCSLAWILHEVLEEVQERFMGKTLTHEGKNPFGESIVDDLTPIVNCSTLNLNLCSIEVGLNLLTDVHQIDETSPVLLAN